MPRKALITNRKWTIALIIFVIAIVYKLSFSANSQVAIVNAITTPLDQAQQDYSFQLTKYVEAKDKFKTSQSSYLTFKTAASKNDAFIKTKDYLTQINNVYKAYLLLIEEKTNTVNWQNASNSKDDLHKRLETEITYLNSQQKKIDASLALEDLPPIAKETKQHLEDSTLNLAYDTLSATNLAQIEDANASFDLNSKKIDTLVSGKIQDQQLYHNWQTEVSGIKSKLQSQIDLVKNTPKIANQFKTEKAQFTFNTKEPIATLKSTKEILREILKFL